MKGVPKGIGILSLTGTTSAVGREDFLTHIILRPEVRSWTEAFSFPVTPYEQEVGCIYFERLRLLNGEPVFLDITMLPNINLPRFTSYNLENTSLFDFLRTKYQIVVTGGTQQLYAIRADKRRRNTCASSRDTRSCNSTARSRLRVPVSTFTVRFSAPRAVMACEALFNN